MIDQATELRKLALLALREQPIAIGPPLRLIALAGGKPGVGVTTVAVNLSVSLAEQGSRVVIVDADSKSNRSDVAALCGLDKDEYKRTTIAARPDIHAILHPGPGGIQIVPGLHGSDGEIGCERLHRQLSTLGRHTDVVVMDLGSQSGELQRRFSMTADEVLLVITPDDEAIMEAYSRIKADSSLASDRSLRLVVNFAENREHAEDVHRRIDRSCRKFLKSTIEFAEHVPFDDAATRGATSRIPFVIGEPMSQAARSLAQLASFVVPSLHRAKIA
jgi:flagellar biosynthesis protein FlhG